MEAPPGAPGPAAAAMRELLSALPDGVQRAEALQLLDRLIHEERACGGRLAHLSMSVTPNLGVPMGVRSDWAGSPGDLGPAGHIDSWGRFGGEDPSSFNTQMTGFIQSGWGETRPEGTAGNFLPNADTGVGSLGEWQDMTRDIELEDNVSGLGPLSESRFLSFVLPSDAGRAPQGAGGNSGTMPLRTSTPAHPGHGSTAGGGMGLDPELTLTAKDSTPPGGKGGKDTWQGAVAPGQSAVGTVGSASRTSSATGLGAPQPGAGAEGKAGFKTAAQVGADTSSHSSTHTNTHTHTPTHAHAHTQSINQSITAQETPPHTHTLRLLPTGHKRKLRLAARKTRRWSARACPVQPVPRQHRRMRKSQSTPPSPLEQPHRRKYHPLAPVCACVRPGIYACGRRTCKSDAVE